MRIGMRRCCAALVVGATLVVSAYPAAAFSARFSWRGIAACGTESPAFVVAAAPRGTAALAFVMRDRDAPDFHHGGSTVPYAGGGTIPPGAITYTGPCPPAGSAHRYVWTIDALDAKGAKLGSTQATGRFPP